jgi:hypothetical protein
MVTKPPDLKIITESLKQTPIILKQLLNQIDSRLYKKKRILNKWSIHEHATHLATGDKVGFIDRFEKFIKEDIPEFKPYSGKSYPQDYFYNLGLNEALGEFRQSRKQLIEMVVKIDNDSFWHKESKHPEYITFTPYIMLRHRLLHDNFHLHRIEELWLTRPEYL